MTTLSIVVLHDENTKPLDVYRTKRSIDDIEIDEIYINVQDWNISDSLSELLLDDGLCLFLSAGDLISQSYINKTTLSFPIGDNIILQPQYVYEFNQSSRMISKNIDIGKFSSTYDSLMLRYCASRHFLSNSKDFLTFVKNYYLEKHSLNFLWEYLIYLLNKDCQLVCLQNVIGYEQHNEYLSARLPKNNGSSIYSAPKLPNSDYSSVLNRSNLNNISIYEREFGDMTTSKLAVGTANSTPIAPKPKDSNVSKKVINSQASKPVSQQDISEAIASNGLTSGVRLTITRLATRMKDRARDNKIDIKTKFIATSQDVKKTLNI